MAQRSSGSVTLTLGLLSIPVKLYTSALAKNVSFKQMTPAGNLVKQLLTDAVTSETVERATLQKGFEVSKNNFLVFTKDEITALDSEKRDTAEIEEFVPADTVDSLEVEKVYHVAPDKGADKAYTLLAKVMAETGRVAVCKWFSKGREHLITIAPRGDGLVFQQMFYENEVRGFDNPVAKVDISEQELDLARMMVNNASSNKYGNPEGDKDKVDLYRNCFSDRVTTAVATKQAGGTVTMAEEPKKIPAGGDLMAVLQASLAQAKTA